MTQEGRFRKDIQIFRGIAIFAVFVFHLKPDWLKSGFLGVDMFFVISGFLISGSIFSDLEAQRFSFKKFYLKRFFRLYPSLLFTLFLTGLLSLAILPVDRFANLKGSLWSATMGLSNLFFWQTLDYFSVSSTKIPLLHTWSLGVEEQFYLIWPVLLFIIFQSMKTRKHMFLVCGLVIALNFFALTLMISDFPQLAFYWMPFRLYEFLFGFSAYLYLSRAPAPFAGSPWIGAPLVIMLGWLFSLQSHNPLQGLLLQVGVVVITALLIASKIPKLLLKAFYPFEKLGDISYSLYLVHWPVIVLYQMRFSPLDSFPELFAVILFCLAISTFMYFSFELYYFRNKKKLIYQKSSLWIFSPLVIFLFLYFLPPLIYPTVLHAKKSFVDANEAKIISFLNRRFAGDLCGNYQLECILGDKESEKTVLLFGDSLAQSLYFGLDKYFKRKGIKLVSVSYPGCLILDNIKISPPIDPKHNFAHHCVKWVEHAFSLVKNNSYPIIFTHKYDGFFRVENDVLLDYPEAAIRLGEALDNNIRELRRQPRRILLFKAYYYPGVEGMECLAEKGLQGHCPLHSKESVASMNQFVNRSIDLLDHKYADVQSIDIDPIICTDTECPLFIDDELLFHDCCHFTYFGSQFVVKRVEEKLDWVIEDL